jgi:hypothetical protein
MATGVKQQQRRGLAADWNTSNHVLDEGELGVTTDTGIIKIGDGVNGWNDLPAAFGSSYLPLLGKAADSELLDGISSDGFYKISDATTTATADKLAKRTAAGRLLAVAGTTGEEVVNYDQMATADAATRRVTVTRTVTADFTLAASDGGGIVFVNGSSYSTTIVCTIPTNATVPIPIGTVIELRTATTAKSPMSLVPASGGVVTVAGATLIYGLASSMRVLKTGTDNWVVLHVNQSPGPILRRKIKTGISIPIGFSAVRLDGADVANLTNNVDTLGTNEQYNAATDLYKCYIRRSGWYDIAAQITLNEGIAQRVYLRLKVNGTNYPLGIGMSKDSLLDIGPRFSDLVPLNVGDYIELEGFRENGTAGTIVETNDSASVFSWAWRRPLS